MKDMNFMRNDRNHRFGGSSSPNETTQEEINDTSSPECSEKSNVLCFLKSSSFKENKQSVRRNIFNHKPSLDIQLSKKNEGSVKRKGNLKVCMKKNKISKKELVSLFNNDVLCSVTKEGKKDSNRSGPLFHLSKSIEIEDQDSIVNVRKECGFNLFPSTVSENDDGIRCHEIIADDEDCQNLVDNCCLKEQIISSQEDVNKSFDEYKYLNSFEVYQESNPKISCEEGDKSQTGSCSPKEEIISSQEAYENKSFVDYKFLNSVEDSKESSSIISVCEEGSQNQVDNFIHKEEIISSQEVYADVPIDDNEVCSLEESKKSSPKILACEEDVYMISHSNSLDHIICSQDSFSNISRIDEKVNSIKHENEEEFSCTSQSLNRISDVKEKMKFQSSAIVYCSQDSHNALFNEDVINEPFEWSAESLKVEHLSENLEYKMSSFEENDQVACSSNNKNEEIVESKRDFFIKTKRKGSLLQRAFCIISALRKEENLFNHEIKVGLRTAKGMHVSEPIIVKNIHYEDGNHVLSCFPSINSGGTIVMQKEEFIHLVISKLTSDLGIESVIVIHFPLVAILVLPSMRVLLFAENRVQVVSVNKSCSERSFLSSEQSFHFMISPKEDKFIYTIKQRDSKNIFGSVVNQLFGHFYSIELRVLHCFKKMAINYPVFEILAVDSDEKVCLIKGSEIIFLKDLNLKEGSIFVFHGFKVKECLRMQNCVKTAAEYYSSVQFHCDFNFILEPYTESWEITLIKDVMFDHTEFTSLSSLIESGMIHKRFKLLIKESKMVLNKVYMNDDSLSEMTELRFDELSIEYKMKFVDLSAPFILNGISLFEGCLFFDKYSQLKLI